MEQKNRIDHYKIQSVLLWFGEILGAVKQEFDKFGDVLEATQQRLDQANKPSAFLKAPDPRDRPPVR